MLLSALAPVLVAADQLRRKFDIAAADATESLQQFVEQSGEQLVYFVKGVRGVRTNPVAGEFTSREALDRLLEETHLAVVEDSETGALLVSRKNNQERFSTDTEHELLIEKETPMKDQSTGNEAKPRNGLVKGFVAALVAGITAVPAYAQDERESEVVELDIFSVDATESVGYKATNAMSATRLSTALIDIPQTINVITADFLEDVNAFTPRDASKWVTNLHPRTNTHQPGVFILRGQQHNLVYVDGYRAVQTERDSAPYARLEVVKGPASAIVGRGEATGVINWVRKRPSATPHVTTKATVGTQDLYRFDVDAGGPLGDSESLSYRTIAFYHNADGHIDFDKIERAGFYPSLLWRPTEKTQVFLQGEVLSTHSPNQIGYSFMWNKWTNNWRNERFRQPETGLDPFLLGIDRSFSLGGPGSFRESDILSLNLIVQHEFTDWMSLRLGATGYDRDRHNVRFQGLPSTKDDPDTDDVVNDNELLNRRYREEEDYEKEFRTQGDLIFQYPALSGDHLTLFGFEAQAFSAERVRISGNLAPINLWDVWRNGKDAAVYDQTILNRASRNTAETAEGYSFFFIHESHFFDGFLNLLYGWRWDRGESWERNSSGVSSFRDPDETTAPRWGVSIKPNSWISAYLVRSINQFPEFTSQLYRGLPADDPRNDATISGQEEGALWEAGIKSELLGGKVSFNFSWFQLIKSDFVFLIPIAEAEPGFELPPGETDPFAFNKAILSDGEKVQGIEVEVFGQPTERLSIVAGLFSQDSESPGSDGTVRELPGPSEGGHFFMKYSFLNADGDGFQVRGGYNVRGPSWLSPLNVPDTKIAESQDWVDLGVSYTRGKNKFDLNVTNVGDEGVLFQANSELEPRAVTFSWRRKW